MPGKTKEIPTSEITQGVVSRPSAVQHGKPMSSADLMNPEFERDLVERIRAGDQDAFSSLYLATRQRVYRFISKHVMDQNEVEDLTQETFLEAYRSIGGFEGRSRLLSWLLGIARHTCMRFFRFSSRWMIGAERECSIDEQVFESRIESRVDALRELDRCNDILSRFRSPADQLIFHRRYYAAMSVRSIAKIAGKTQDAVKASLSRSRRALTQNGMDPNELAA